MKSFENLSDLVATIGQEMGTSSWHLITQEEINTFGKVTGDEQWIHTNPEMAAKFSPFKTTVAHGFFSLSLSPKFMAEIFTVKSVKMGLNYGANKVRFINPVPVNSKVRMHCKLIEAENQEKGGLKIIMECTFEIEGAAKPACVAEMISVLYE